MKTNTPLLLQSFVAFKSYISLLHVSDLLICLPLYGSVYIFEPTFSSIHKNIIFINKLFQHDIVFSYTLCHSLLKAPVLDLFRGDVLAHLSTKCSCPKVSLLSSRVLTSVVFCVVLTFFCKQDSVEFHQSHRFDRSLFGVVKNWPLYKGIWLSWQPNGSTLKFY